MPWPFDRLLQALLLPPRVFHAFICRCEEQHIQSMSLRGFLNMIVADDRAGDFLLRRCPVLTMRKIGGGGIRLLVERLDALDLGAAGNGEWQRKRRLLRRYCPHVFRTRARAGEAGMLRKRTDGGVSGRAWT